MKLLFTSAVIITILFAACGNGPDLPVEPNILDVYLDHQNITVGADTVTLYIEFEDGDGNISFPDGDNVSDIELTDSRTGFIYYYQIPELNPNPGEEAMSGTIQVHLAPFDVNCRPTRPNFDTLSYGVVIMDRDKQRSNSVSTDPLILKCP